MTFAPANHPAATARPEASGSRAKTYLLGSLREDLAEVYRSKPLRRLAIVVGITTTANYTFFAMYSIFFTETFAGHFASKGAVSRHMSLTMSLSTVTGMAAFPVARRVVERFGGYRVVFGSTLAWAATYLGLFLAANPWVSSGLFLVPIYAFFLVGANTAAAEIARSERRGGGLGALAGVSALSMALGAVIGGMTGDISLSHIPLVSSLGTFTAALASIVLLLRERRKRTLDRKNGSISS